MQAQPLSPEQIQDYLEHAQGDLAGLQSMLREDPTLRELARSPLMLSILTRTYQGQTAQFARGLTPDAQRQQIFADYVALMLRRRHTDRRYNRQQTTDWLTWLAQQLSVRNQTAFYLERLQMDWLTKTLACQNLHDASPWVSCPF